MRRLFLMAGLFFFHPVGKSQTTVFSDNLNTSAGTAYSTVNGLIGTSTVWTLTRSASDWGARIDGGIMDLTNDATAAANVIGWAYVNTAISGFSSPFNPVLNLNTSLVTWTFNMRQNRSDPSGFDAGNYGVGFLLGNSVGNGYAVMLGGTGATDPVRLTRYTTAINNANITNLISSNTPGLTDFGNEYLSIKVTYDPLTNTWELFVRNDGTTAFADPTVGTLTSQGTVVDNTHTGLTMATMGGYWEGSTGMNETAFFDNVKVVVGVAPTITTGTVSSTPFILANCAATASGFVDFSSTGTFTGTNDFTAQLSDDAGSFASPVNIGTLNNTGGVNPSGTIPITIPAGTPGGTGYLIRVVSNDPAATGTSSTAFTITQNGPGGCNSAAGDYYRSVQSGNWSSTSTWESSPDNSTWIPATRVPDFNANIILVRSPHTVTIDATASADQLSINAGATLVHQNGITFTLNNGAGTDMTVNGTYVLNGTQPTGAGTVEIPAAGIVRVDDNSAPNLSDDFAYGNTNVLFRTGSIYEWNTSGFTPEWSGRVYFTSGEIVVFRFSASPNFDLSGNSPTVIYGVLDVNAPIEINGTGIKYIVNGITGSANLTTDPAFTGIISIEGAATAVLGGTGLIDLTPFTNSLSIGPGTTVTMLSNKTINGSLNLFGDSYVELGGFNLTVTGTITGGASNAYIRTNGAGALTLQTVGAGGKIFPIGNTSYNPLTVTNGNNENFTARVQTGINPAIAFPSYGVNRTWSVHASNNTTATLRFQYSAADANPNVIPGGDIEILQHTGVAWSIIPGNGIIPAAGVNPYTVTSLTNLPVSNSAVPYALGKAGGHVLPLDFFISARSHKTGQVGFISWDVQDLSQVLKFELEKAVNADQFSVIAIRLPAGNIFSYLMMDSLLQNGKNLYRVKVTMRNGHIRYSNTVAIINGTQQLLITGIRPNPVSGDAFITVSAAEQRRADLAVFNIRGQQLMGRQINIKEGNNLIQLPVSQLTAGTYWIRIQSGKMFSHFSFVKQ